ncbi:adenosylcobyric acid synthase (glutamine-hydrolysing) [Archaeoglobus sulfaticallidus PM70-1]|uniref:Probable cobyric acid synthase n=1 Tax=Archaeoglobus sulfaticallidus PM70-1 TaxID=387631 RepID=N0BGQ4_9EURY|nr:cobyric acid synthase CobQ [Archaeoglobus sulfaticallidus]AGK62188.1 adenosylcobyric acid synthase (glutamine-hydrolysing) [Archaeoglobus sulfaticallidus PM70-1]
MPSIFIGATSSHAGKSLITASLCKIISKMGYRVAPFKAQNMSLNSFITRNGKEIAIAQAFQAQSAGIEPDERMNPILLKPKGNFISQLVVMGEAVGDISSKEYYRKVPELFEVVKSCYESLAEEYEIIVIEGAGGMAEINLYDRDIANIGTIRMANPDVYIVGDIERGGVFSSVYGTYSLLPSDVRDRVKGFIINKLRGYEDVLESGIKQIESMTGLKCIGILPFMDFPLFSEDSLSIPEWGSDGEICVLRLPRISNFTDFEPLRFAGVRFADLNEKDFDCDILIIPGTKDTIADLKALKDTGMDERIKKLAGKIPIIGICGGYQILGKELIDKGVEHGVIRTKGLGLLDAVTVFDVYRKTTRQVRKRVTGDAVILDRIKGNYVWGYEIHKGRSISRKPIFEDDGTVSDDGMVWGTYLHGLFWNDIVVRAVCDYLGIKYRKGEDGMDRLTKIVEEKMDIDFILRNLN